MYGFNRHVNGSNMNHKDWMNLLTKTWTKMCWHFDDGKGAKHKDAMCVWLLQLRSIWKQKYAHRDQWSASSGTHITCFFFYFLLFTRNIKNMWIRWEDWKCCRIQRNKQFLRLVHVSKRTFLSVIAVFSLFGYVCRI